MPGPGGGAGALEGRGLWLDGVILDVDGGGASRGGIRIDGSGTASAQEAGAKLAASLLASGGAALLARARAVASSHKS